MTPKMMMVDQLWLWVLDYKVIVTAFPKGEIAEGTRADVLHSIIRELGPALEDRSIKSVNGLVSLIISKCTGVFHQRNIPEDLEFFQFFADAIGAAKNEQFQAFHQFHRTSTHMEADMDSSAQGLDSLFTIDKEITLMAKVKAIINDLHKIDFIIGQQIDVVRSLEKYSKASRSIRDLCETVEHRRNAWSGMADTANKTYESLRDLMDLKQRQANVWEARIARNQVEVTARHGRSIMLFTIVTIIFLPMSVMATIFGMNVKQLNSGSSLGLGSVSAILFPVSIVIAVLALVLAFNETLRELLLRTLRGIYSVGLKCTGLERFERRPVGTRPWLRRSDVEAGRSHTRRLHR
jgi:CorA-like Mg2+ transporter protein